MGIPRATVFLLLWYCTCWYTSDAGTPTTVRPCMSLCLHGELHKREFGRCAESKGPLSISMCLPQRRDFVRKTPPFYVVMRRWTQSLHCRGSGIRLQGTARPFSVKVFCQFCGVESDDLWGSSSLTWSCRRQVRASVLLKQQKAILTSIASCDMAGGTTLPPPRSLPCLFLRNHGWQVDKRATTWLIQETIVVEPSLSTAQWQASGAARSQEVDAISATPGLLWTVGIHRFFAGHLIYMAFKHIFYHFLFRGVCWWVWEIYPGSHSLSLCLHPSAGIIETLLLAAKLREEERTISGSTKAGRALGKLWASTSFLLLGPPGASQKGQMHEVACRRNLLSRV